MRMRRFTNRSDAGKQLARALKKYEGRDVVVFALPRGGVVIGAEVAEALHAPLDLIITRKVGHPQFPECAIAAVGRGGEMIVNNEEVASVHPKEFEMLVQREQEEAQRRYQAYLHGRNPRNVKGKTAIIVDDGIATGLTIRAAILELKQLHPKHVVVAVPVASTDALSNLAQETNEVVCLVSDPSFQAVGAYYDSFPAVSDAQVVALMDGVGK